MPERTAFSNDAIHDCNIAFKITILVKFKKVTGGSVAK